MLIWETQSRSVVEKIYIPNSHQSICLVIRIQVHIFKWVYTCTTTFPKMHRLLDYFPSHYCSQRLPENIRMKHFLSSIISNKLWLLCVFLNYCSDRLHKKISKIDITIYCYCSMYQKLGSTRSQMWQILGIILKLLSLASWHLYIYNTYCIYRRKERIRTFDFF